MKMTVDLKEHSYPIYIERGILKEAAEKGNLDDFVNKNLSQNATKQLKDVLSNKEACEKLLSSPQAKELMKKLTEGK